MKTLAIICPIYNEEDSIFPFYQDLINSLSVIDKNKYEIRLLFSNNSSTDNSLKYIKKLIDKNEYIKVDYISLTRNFGYQASLTAALRSIDSDLYVLIDVDMEDPTYMIIEFLKEYESGYEFVYGIRRNRPEPRFITLLRRSFYRITHYIADVEFLVDVAEFSLFTRRFKEMALSTKSTFPFLRGDFASIGFSRKGIPYDREKRRFGKTHYNFFGMFKFAFAGILSSSTFPLRITAYLGIFNLIIEAVIFSRDLLLGYEHANLSQFIFKTYIYIALSSIAIYIARTYKNGIGRPLFIIDWEKSTLKPN